jgi:hypothetical protein
MTHETGTQDVFWKANVFKSPYEPMLTSSGDFSENHTMTHEAEKYGDLQNCIFYGNYACVGLISIKKGIQGKFILYGEELGCREA